MSHSHDKTYIASLGFSDPDRNTSEHDMACRYLSEKETVLKLVNIFGQIWQDNCEWKKIVSSQEFPIEQKSGSFQRTIGFADVVIDCKISTGEQKTIDEIIIYQMKYLTALIEVKIKKQSINTAIRQLKFYQSYSSFSEIILATKFKISEQEKMLLENEGIKHIFLGKNFEEYCNNIKENHKDAEMMEI